MRSRIVRLSEIVANKSRLLASDYLKGEENMNNIKDTEKKPKAINPANKTRLRERPYAHWTDPRNGWQYWLLKAYQADNAKPEARWFLYVQGYEAEYGDTWVKDLLRGLLVAAEQPLNITFDLSIWPTQEAFIAWVKGSKSPQQDS